MKKIAILLSIVLLSACNSSKEKSNDKNATDMASEKINQTVPYENSEMLLGLTNREGLQMPAFTTWFTPGYDSYKVDEETMKSVTPLLNDTNITVFMGSWCEDSHHDVPHLYKILDAAGFDESKLRVISLSEEKTSPEGYENDFDILQVPTIILYKNGEELGRIVEYPIQSLEKDMLAILSGEDYKHAYDY